MSARIAHIWRHPIKAHGAEAIEGARLSPGQGLPCDRHWAVAHEASDADGSEWANCANFNRGAKAPALMAIRARLDEKSGKITLTHPDRPPLTFDPDGDQGAFIQWVRPLIPDGRAAPARLVRARSRAMTDTPFPSISINSLDTLKEMSARAGKPLSPLRWRGNIWLEGLAPWKEFEWIGKRLRIGEAVLEIREPITRCRATSADPETGRIDIDTLALLEKNWGHRDFGVYGVVVEPGRIAVGDEIEVL